MHSGSITSSSFTKDNTNYVTVLQIHTKAAYHIEDFFLNPAGAKTVRDLRLMYFQNVLGKEDLGKSLVLSKVEAKLEILRLGLRDNIWLIRTVSTILDFLLCSAYLYEIQFNMYYPNPPEMLSIPSWLLVNRPLELWYFLMISVFLKLMMIFLLSIIWYKSLHLQSMNVTASANIIMVLAFCCYAFVPISRFLYFPYWLFCLNVVYNIRLIAHSEKKSMPFKITEFSEKMWILLSSVVILVYSSMCIMNFIETRFSNFPKSSELGILNLFYLIIITFTTIGYGDVVPMTKPGQAALLLLILVALLILPMLIDDVIETVRKQSQGAGSFFCPDKQYVVLVGEFSDTHRILQVIHTIQRRDYLQKKATLIVLFARSEIPQDLRYAIKEFKLRHSVQYFLQSNTTQAELERVKPKNASIVFILGNYRIEDESREDNYNLLQAMAFDRAAPNTPIYAETRMPNTAENLQDVVTGAICLSTVKQIFLAYGTLYQGISTLLVNLLRGSEANYELCDSPWLDQYLDGAKNEIFKVPFGPAFIGKPFSQIALHLYCRRQVVLFACHIYIEDRNIHHVALNPKNYVIKEGDHGFFIAESVDGLKEMVNEPIQQCERGLRALKEAVKDIPPLSHKHIDRNEYLETNGYFLGYPKVYDNGRIPLCVLTKTIPKLEDCVIENADHLDHHILIVSGNFHLFRMLCALRTSHLKPEELLPILIMTPKLPSAHDFSRFSGFPRIYFMVGHPHKSSYLRRAGAPKAFRIIVTNLSKHHCREMTDDTLLDSNVIMVSNAIHRIFREQDRTVPAIIDLMHSSNSQFLLPGSNNFVPRQHRTIEENPKEFSDDTFISPMFASGSVLSISMIESVMINTYFQKSILNLFNCFTGVRYRVDVEIDEVLNLEVSNVSSIKVPSSFVEKTYGQLFEALSLDNVIPIGILRGVVPELQNRLPFVYTNPVSNLILLANDYIYILG